MKKVLLVASLLWGIVASAATDSYLYWMIDSGAPAYDTAKIRAGDSSSYLNIYATPGSSSIGDYISDTQVDSARNWGVGLYAGMLDADSLPASIIVELWHGGAFVGQAVLNSGIANYIYAGNMSTPPSTAASFSGFAIPEPSSGLLMLVGCAVLGLRRRRQKNA